MGKYNGQVIITDEAKDFIARIREQMADQYGVSPTDLYDLKCRIRPVSRARRELILAMMDHLRGWYSKPKQAVYTVVLGGQYPTLPTTVLANIFDCDHSSIIAMAGLRERVRAEQPLMRVYRLLRSGYKVTIETIGVGGEMVQAVAVIDDGKAIVGVGATIYKALTEVAINAAVKQEKETIQ